MNRKSFLQKKFNTGFVNNTTGATLNLKACFPNKDLKPKIYGSTIQSNLPVEYQEVEYIESTGTQYINTDYLLSNSDIVDIEYMSCNNSSTAFGLFGARNTLSNYYYYVIVSNVAVWSTFGGVNPSNLDTNPYNHWGNLHCESGNVTFNNIVRDTRVWNTFNTDITLSIFTINGAYSPIACRIRKFIVSKNNEIKINFIPCYRKSDNTIGMYDIVNNVFYTNAGTGTFLKGNDVVPTPNNSIEIQSLGDRTDNLIDYTTVQPTSNTSITLINNGFKVVGKYAGKIVVEGLKPNTDYFLSYIRENIIGNTQSVVIFSGTTTTTNITTLVKPGVFNTGNNTTINIWFYTSIGGNDNESNFTNIQLKEGISETDYEPYGYKIPVKNSGKNSLKGFLPEVTSKDGLTITKNDDGTYIINGTSTATNRFNITSITGKLYFKLEELGFKEGDVGFLSGCPVGRRCFTTNKQLPYFYEWFAWSL